MRCFRCVLTIRKIDIQDPEAHVEEQRTITPSLLPASSTVETSPTPPSSASFKCEALTPQETWRRVFDTLKASYELSHITDSGLPLAAPKSNESKTILRQIKVVQRHDVHEAKIKWLQFSPAGTCLATTR